ncbi:hypothetical protein MUP77_24790, partial [Candidatus Bathyarchaeota archaeon]|nr:hypothetical protein [Candidatus Bathyarchaeota archaeon]
ALMLYRSIFVRFAKFCGTIIDTDNLLKVDGDTVREDRIPTQRELRKIFENANPRTRAIMSFQAFSAMRFKPICKLKLKHLKDLKITAEGIEISKVPMQIHIPKLDDEGKPFDKRSVKHETFMIGEGCEYVLDYLRSRIKQGERLTPESYVIKKKVAGKPVVEFTMEKNVKYVLNKIGFVGRPYVLKKFCENRMLASELKESYQKYFSGWKAGAQLITRYSLSVELPPEFIEELRREYAKTEPFLSTVPEINVQELSQEIQEKDRSQKAHIEALRKELEEEKTTRLATEKAFNKAVDNLNADKNELEQRIDQIVADLERERELDRIERELKK